MTGDHISPVFIDVWKATSIGVTGILGVLGLVTDFRKKETNKITNAGYCTLALIATSACLGILAQVIDNFNQAKYNEMQLDKLVKIAE